MNRQNRNLHEGLLTDDIFAATERAKQKSAKLLEDEGIAAIAILLSEALRDFIDNPGKVMEKLK
jgi:hypothetical protein